MHLRSISILLTAKLHISPSILTNAVLYWLFYLPFSGAAAQTNAWRVLDRIIAATQHLLSLDPLPAGCPEVNPTTGCLTVWLWEYESCGYTRDVNRELFKRKNSETREALSNQNILFTNVEQAYEKKKMQICVQGDISTIPDSLLTLSEFSSSSSSSSTPSMSQSSESSESQSS
jgi:hypothetical protein